MRIALRLLIVALLVLATACNRGVDATTTTSTGPGAAPATTLPGQTAPPPGEGSTSTTAADTTTTEPLVELTYEIRTQGQGGGGEILVIQVPGGVATDRALESLFLELVDEYSPVQRMEIVDSGDAVDLVLRDPTTLSEEEQAVLDAHHLLRFMDNNVTFQGPFADLDGWVYGS